MITTKHEREVHVYRLKNVVYAEFNSYAECNAFETWHNPLTTEFSLVRSQELRGLDHVNVVPEGYQHRYEAYIDGLCEAYKEAPKAPNTMEVPASIVGINGPRNPATGGPLTDAQYTNYLLELILQAIKEK